MFVNNIRNYTYVKIDIKGEIMAKYLVKSDYTILGKVAQGQDNEMYKVNDEVLIEDANGVHFVKIIAILSDTKKDSEYKIIRKATNQDLENKKRNEKKIEQATKVCNDNIKKLNLQMNLKKVYANYDASKIIFYFTADDRVDFRELVKKLATNFAKTRIEMRQITEREEVAMLGGVGLCGRICCCASFLEDFGQVTIKMAKNQNIALNPNKVNGFCGKLLCCLGYENNDYIEALSIMPKIGDVVNLPDGTCGVVHYNHLIKKIVRVEIKDEDESIYKEFTLEELAQFNDKFPKGYEIINFEDNCNVIKNDIDGQ